MTKIALAMVMALCLSVAAHAQRVLGEVDGESGGLMSLTIEGDTTGTNYVLRADGSQYEWVTRQYAWGTGALTVDGVRRQWMQPATLSEGRVTYELGNVRLTVDRMSVGDELTETYTFTNIGTTVAVLTEVAIHTPFNDNYPDAETCVAGRCNAHIWARGTSSYVNAMRMSGQGIHLGLVLTEGSLCGYEVDERAREKALSNFRGVISLCPDDMRLAPGESRSVAWTLFAHTGWDDFTERLLAHGSVVAETDHYVYAQGEEATVRFRTRDEVKTVSPSTAELGHHDVVVTFADGRVGRAEILVVSHPDSLMRRRAEFIVARQQMTDETDSRYGAYMVYDNEGDSIYLNDTPNCSRHDRDEGRERLGMGIFLAKMYGLYGGETLRQSLLRYVDFVHRLQDADYNTYSNAEHRGRNRNYNYAWVAAFYVEMFRVTGDKPYLTDAYLTLKALFRNFGRGFYAIELPVDAYTLLLDNGFTDEARSLLDDLCAVADAYAANGSRYPRSEVNYEQSIVAPSIIHLLRMYRLTDEPRYLDGAREQMPLLEAFGGRQPSYHLNDIAIRHWDGYWFGKRECWGDTFPHYWSTLTAQAFDLYGRLTDNPAYTARARNILLNNLCLFTEDGRGSCAYVYPMRVNGQSAAFYDPYANDQDWALAFYIDTLR